MKKTSDGRPLPATVSGPKPGDFPLGSLESRAAARAALGASIEKSCICFPADEPPLLQLRAEREAAKAVLCPLHGVRFTEFARSVWRVIRRPEHLTPDLGKGHSEQYIKAMKASFPPDRWPAQEVTDPDGTIRYVLKDGTEIYCFERQPVYDTGLPISETQLAAFAPRGHNGVPDELTVEIPVYDIDESTGTKVPRLKSGPPVFSQPEPLRSTTSCEMEVTIEPEEALFHMKDGKAVLEESLKKAGVYVLYRGDEPYYIGKTSRPLFKRLSAHALKPNARRYNFWNYFSAFEITNPSHRDEVEAIPHLGNANGK